MGTILERNGTEEWEQRHGKMCWSLQCWNAGTLERTRNSNSAPTSDARREQNAGKNNTICGQHTLGYCNNKWETRVKPIDITEVCRSCNTLSQQEQRGTHRGSVGPGHMGIAGNDRVDEIAKEVTELEPATETTTLANLFWQIWESMKLEWVNE